VGDLGDGEWISPVAQHCPGGEHPDSPGDVVRAVHDDELLSGKGVAQPMQCHRPRKIQRLIPRISAGRTSTATASGFRLRTTQPRRDRTGTTLNLDADGVYRWYSRCSSPPRSRDARGRRVATHTGENERTERPHRHPSRQSFGTARRVRDRKPCRGSHLGSTLNPGRAVLTGGVFRRSGSVACIRADASPSEVLAPTIVDDQTGCRQAY